MPAKWIMYIPRAKTLAEQTDVGNKPSLSTRAEGWRKHVEGKTDDGGQKYQFFVRFLGDTLPNPLDDGDVIYVFGGHGITARDGIGWPGDNGNLIDAATVAHRLVGEGLAAGFAGRIKVYSCHSGEGGNSAFAKLVATALKATAPKCTVYGYTGQITQSYEEINLSKITHKGKYKGPEDDAGTHRWSIINAPFYAGRTSKTQRTQY